MDPSPPSASLRMVLVDAGLALLEEGGPQALTLRRAAARAGVSHAAPAHHFDGLAGLMTAMAEKAFRLFAEAMVTRRDAAAAAPEARLHAICEGYLAFARAHSGLFHLMFASPEVRHADPALRSASGAAYQVLREGCAPFAGDRPEQLELAVWSLVHGYASLGFAKEGGPGDPYRRRPEFAALLRLILPEGPARPANPLAASPGIG